MTSDGQPFARFEVTSPTSIRITTTIDMRHFRIVTGYRGGAQRADESQREHDNRRPAAAAAGLAGAQQGANARTRADRSAGSQLLTVTGAGCPCCAG